MFLSYLCINCLMNGVEEGDDSKRPTKTNEQRQKDDIQLLDRGATQVYPCQSKDEYELDLF